MTPSASARPSEADNWVPVGVFFFFFLIHFCGLGKRVAELVSQVFTMDQSVAIQETLGGEENCIVVSFVPHLLSVWVQSEEKRFKTK